MMDAPDPVRLENDSYILAATAEASLTVVAWGNHGRWAGRSHHLMTHLGPVWALGVTKRREPRHPLYVRGDVEPVEYRAPGWPPDLSEPYRAMGLMEALRDKP